MGADRHGAGEGAESPTSHSAGDRKWTLHWAKLKPRRPHSPHSDAPAPARTVTPLLRATPPNSQLWAHGGQLYSNYHIMWLEGSVLYLFLFFVVFCIFIYLETERERDFVYIFTPQHTCGSERTTQVNCFVLSTMCVQPLSAEPSHWPASALST